MATTGAANQFVVNIIELQNTVTTASGLTPFDTLNTKIGQIEQMVNVDQKQIFVNTLSSYNQGFITVTDPINIGPTGGLSIGGVAISAGATGSVGPTGLAGPTGPVGPGNYTATPANWVGTGPTTISSAIDRMASLLVSLNGGNPIP
jgi:hypothetical protein